MSKKSIKEEPCSKGSIMPGLSHRPDSGAFGREESRQDNAKMTLEGGSKEVQNYIRRRKRLVHVQHSFATHIYHKEQWKRVASDKPPIGVSNIIQTRCCLGILILAAALATTCCLALEQSNRNRSSLLQSVTTMKELDGRLANVSQASIVSNSGSSYQINGQQKFKNQSAHQSEEGVEKPSSSANAEASSRLLGQSAPSRPPSKVKIPGTEAAKTTTTEVANNQLAQTTYNNSQAVAQLVVDKFGSSKRLVTSAPVDGNDDKLQPQSTQLVSSTTTELSPFLGSASGQGEVLVTADSKKKKKMMKKKKKMEKKHKEWKKGKKHKKKKYESKKKKGGMSKKKKGKKEKKKWGMEKKGHKKKGNFKKKKWGHKKKMKKGHKKGKKGHKMLKDKGHKKKGFKKVYHKEEWGKKKKWHDIKREKKWNTKQKKWKKKWHQEKGKKYKGKHMKKYHKKNKHGKKYKKEKKSKWKKHKGEKYKKGHKKKKEEYSKKKEGGKKKKMKKEMKKKKG